MEEVVSVSDLSPLEAGITGGTMAPFSCSAGCSGTGIANNHIHTKGKKHYGQVIYSFKAATLKNASKNESYHWQCSPLCSH